MKNLITGITVFISVISYAQKDFTFNVNEVEIKFQLNTLENLIEEKISITNHSEGAVYIPVPSEKEDIYFFHLGDKVNSFYGITNSIRGPYPLGGQVFLKKIESGESFNYEVSMKLKSNNIKEYYFSFDFIEDNASSIKFKKGKYFIEAIKYLDVNESLYSSYKI